MLYKDACNAKSNQQNLGTIKCSNLCTEIVEYTSKDEVAVCNLASIVLPKFCSPVGQRKKEELPLHGEVYNIASSVPSVSPVSSVPSVPTENDGTAPETMPQSSTERGINGYLFDHKRLYDVTKVITRNLNKIIDINYYPIPEAKNSNMRHRPIGMGVQGLADAFQLMKLPFDSPEARRLNIDIFETIYYAALDASCELAAIKGTYESYSESPASKGTVVALLLVSSLHHPITFVLRLLLMILFFLSEELMENPTMLFVISSSCPLISTLQPTYLSSIALTLTITLTLTLILALTLTLNHTLTLTLTLTRRSPARYVGCLRQR